MRNTVHRRHTRQGIRLDVTAMVDVAFLLVAFFMLTARMPASGAAVLDLPESHASVKLPFSNIIMITVSENPLLTVDATPINRRVVRGLRVRPADLPQTLVRLRVSNPALRAVIKADRDIPYGRVEDVMEALQEAQITRFALITDLRKG